MLALRRSRYFFGWGFHEMSHKASHWLATIPAEAISASAFRVLFHLCDAHNSQRDPETACFPSQEKLRASTGLSNGGLNNALNALEAANLIRRRRTRNADGTRGPTYYILGCDRDLSQEPPPENGDGEKAAEFCAPAGDKVVEKAAANSKSGRKPSPNSGVNQLHQGGDEPVIDPVKKEPVIACARASGAPPVDFVPPSAERRVAVVAELARKYPGLVRPPGSFDVNSSSAAAEGVTGQ
jgi:DNA-binding MarR family transcriptional regulator